MPNEVVIRLPRAQAMTIVALLASHPYSQVAELLYSLQLQLNSQSAPPAPGLISEGKDGSA